MTKERQAQQKPPDLKSALRDADWEKLLPSLVAYATNCLRRAGWAAGRDVEPSKMSVEQIIQTAVEHCLEGKRVWDPSVVDLGGFLRGTIRSLTSSERKAHVRAHTFPKAELDAYMPLAASTEEDVVDEERQREVLAIVEACIKDDPDLELFYAAVLDGNTKREDLADALGWNADRVTAARIKLQRRLMRAAPSTFAPSRERQRRLQ